MSQTVSPGTGRAYGLARVTQVWRLSRATVYRHRAAAGAEPPQGGADRVVRPVAETVGCAVQAAKGRLAGGHGARPRCSARIWFGLR